MNCRDCGAELANSEQWTPDELVVCLDCWYDLDARDRKAIAEEAHRKREVRLGGVDQ